MLLSMTMTVSSNVNIITKMSWRILPWLRRR